ncbi:MAG: hypothetical protein WHT81_06340 [Rectinemataceae bacterium]|nr:hypothetical protein [Spirochaetaceae bacterium]
MKLTIRTTAAAVIVLFAGGILLASALGFWVTESTKEPAKIKTGEFAGMPNPSDIRGSYTWNDISKSFGIDVGLLMQAFGVKDASTKVNTLEEAVKSLSLPPGVEIGTDAVRLFVALYTGLPHTPEESTVLPYTAAEILLREGKADKALIEAAAARAVKPAGTTPAAEPAASAVPAATGTANTAPAPAPAPAASTTKTKTETVTAPAAAAPAATTPQTATATQPAATTTTETHVEKPTGTVVGKTTFGELKQWGVSVEDIKAVLGGKIGPDPMAIKDFATQNELSFSEIKTKLQELVDKAKK